MDMTDSGDLPDMKDSGDLPDMTDSGDLPDMTDSQTGDLHEMAKLKKDNPDILAMV